MSLDYHITMPATKLNVEKLTEIIQNRSPSEQEMITEAYAVILEKPTDDISKALVLAKEISNLGMDAVCVSASLLSVFFMNAAIPCTLDASKKITVVYELLSDLKAVHKKVLTLEMLWQKVKEDIRIPLLLLIFYTYHLREHIAQESFVKIDHHWHSFLMNGQQVYVPLANRLGIGQYKIELEELLFSLLEPEHYARIQSLLHEAQEAMPQYMTNIKAFLEQLLESHGIEGKVFARTKHIASIYQKMQEKNLPFHQILDIRAVRIIVPTISDCYKVLSVIQERWPHLEKEFDDYVANPKANGYQSLHAAVIGPEGKLLEVQIRTPDMHRLAELGIAAHWAYKDSSSKV